MLNDPIVQAVRQVREELAAEFGYDVHQIFADMRQREPQFGDRLIQQPITHRSPKSLPTEKAANGEFPATTLG